MHLYAFLQVDDKNHHAKLGSKWKHILHPSTWRGHLTLSACEDLGRTFPALPPLRRAEDQDVLIFLGGVNHFSYTWKAVCALFLRQ